MKPARMSVCDKCHKEIRLKTAIIRYPIFIGILFSLCPACAKQYDDIEKEIDNEAEQIKEKAFKEFMGIK